MSFFQPEQFKSRHIGPRTSDLSPMLQEIGASSLDALIDETVPRSIRSEEPLALPEAMPEQELLSHLRELAKKNSIKKSYIGMGYYDCITPPVIQRNIFENPGWYTQYTPYQPEISQGRLEALLNFQTMVTDLTAMDVANASLLDEGTAAAEAMAMVSSIVHKERAGDNPNKFFVSVKCFPQTIEVVRTRAYTSGIDVVVGNHETALLDRSYFGALVQYPAMDGNVCDFRSFIQKAKESGIKIVVAADLLALAVLTPPGEWGADVVVGSSQRFGIPMGFGGPHAAFFATRTEYIRQMPGRIIGVSVDAKSNRAYRMTLQTREQHIRREKATSNICTAQALLAIMAGMYAVYHGPKGIRTIADRVHGYAVVFDKELKLFGFKQLNQVYFDTVKIATKNEEQSMKIGRIALEAGCNIRIVDATTICISFDETTTVSDLNALLRVFGRFAGYSKYSSAPEKIYSAQLSPLPELFNRTSAYLAHPVFNSYHSESEMMRYIKKLERKDLSLTQSMIPLGSCTMKLNAAAEMIPVSFPEFASLHPYIDGIQSRAYHQIFRDLKKYLCEITGFAEVSFQPNSGAQGEYAGLLSIRRYFDAQNEKKRKVALIPASAHGTNPASAVMAGFTVVVVQCDASGNIDLADLKAKAAEHAASLGVLMATYPSTHGVFEESIEDICKVIHERGGMVYMDGANMNAQVGLTSPARMGADVCHLNLHKTFSIPHGGGGPGVGPICVVSKLTPYLPGFAYQYDPEKMSFAVASAPFSSASVMLISYAYIRMMGAEGLTEATKHAILNANYLSARLEKYFPVLYKGSKGRVAHEFILHMKEFKSACGVEVEDIAKRLMDYGFHAPTVSFPVHDSLMIEPTESESKEELDRFADALINIRKEIDDIASGAADKSDNLLKNAPHSSAEAVSDLWQHPYSRKKAIFPLPFVEENKFWIPVSRINSTYGDKNIFCTCPPTEAYRERKAE